jgi:hypothetical protein
MFSHYRARRRLPVHNQTAQQQDTMQPPGEHRVFTEEDDEVFKLEGC